MFTRRHLLQLSALAPFIGLARAQANKTKAFAHAVSIYGDLKYPAGFKNFDYVNPQAPKGGKLRQAAYGTFDSLNPWTVKGDPPYSGILAHLHDTLMARAQDEPSSNYALIAEGISVPDDRSSATFLINKAARFHDGHPITPEDAIFTLQTLKANLPQYAAYYKNVARAEKSGEREVTFIFSEAGNRELPAIVSEMSVLPKHWWQAKGADGKARNSDEASLEIPLGSGPYRIKTVKAGELIVMERVKDYWAKDLPVNVGQYNFDEIAHIYFKNQLVAFEAFKADGYDYQWESSSKQWSVGYDFPAAKDGRVLKDPFEIRHVQGMQAFALNLRRAKFQDIRLRRAMILAFDFTWLNANLFYGMYRQSRSFFNVSGLEAKGAPSPEELALLEPFRAELPPEVFTTEYQNPQNPDAQARRKNLQAAARLLDEAGWKADDAGGKRVLKNAAGESLAVEFLLDSPVFERIVLPYKEQLELLGFAVTVRTLDDAEMTRRRVAFEYDIIVEKYAQSPSPGNEQRDFFGSVAADQKGSRNFCGIKSPAVDALIEKLVFAKDRAALVTAARALDRVLMWNAYMIPQWYSPTDNTARWDRFGHPANEPAFGSYIEMPAYWWWDEAKARKISG